MSCSRSITDAAHRWLQQLQLPKGWLVDMTVGGGYDTLFMASRWPELPLLAIDIQPQALQRARDRLGALGVRVQWRLGCHSGVEQWLDEQPIALAIYNLGYLPGSDKGVITQAGSTVASLQAVAARLAPGGAISLMLYTGHPGGQEEADAVLQELRSWPARAWSIWHMARLSRSQRPAPQWVLVQRH